LSVALLDFPRQLRQGDDRHLQLLGQGLDRARDLGNFGGAVLVVAVGAHQLQVVDDDQAELAELPVQAPGAGAQVGRVDGAGLVDVDRRLVQLAQRHRHAIPLVVGQAAGAQLALVDAADR
jgi:hypothetical protein